jgi:hypothetical protein
MQSLSLAYSLLYHTQHIYRYVDITTLDEGDPHCLDTVREMMMIMMMFS